MNTQELKRMDEKVSENQEMEQLFNFLNKNKNILIALLAVVVVAIFGYDYYKKSEAEGKLLAQNRLYEISVLFADKKFDSVIKEGNDYAKKFSGYLASDEIKIFVAKAYNQNSDLDNAIKSLESISSKNDLVNFSVANLLGVYYQNKLVVTKDNSFGVKSAESFLSSGKMLNGIFKDEADYNAAYSYFLSGDKEKAKSILEKLKEKKYDVNPKSIKDKTEDLLLKL
ncbi:MAG: hypothetical protein CR982_09480 [Candidatus Cloacimonadota bacterium]|nr:MAG: hypothetical protein CR982_09480 [Candidatus Cloacimonadota bacterium]PIE79271.1 MAG: hypothetical protein CSA15_03655 [Candidatus Delongbacteria bacterium]